MLVSAAVIKVTVKKAARKRGIKTWYKLAQKLAKVSGKKPEGRHQELAKRLWKGDVLPRLESVDSVAEALDCDLSELLHRVPEKSTPRAGPPKRSAMKRTQNALSSLTNQADDC